ncbi:hypothetical protein KY285_006071 [Solanum tuberosum]|nr:hypothetical protein KY289_006567 [Solanum tuberosum]KAH0752923.1 hypothetical protein KY285_006071 [Solanum tuberosum]
MSDERVRRLSVRRHKCCTLASRLQQYNFCGLRVCDFCEMRHSVVEDLRSSVNWRSTRSEECGLWSLTASR